MSPSASVAAAPAAERTPDHPPAKGAAVSEGRQVRLRRHVVENRPAFQRWYADPDIAFMLRHDQQPLSAAQSKNYFDTLIMPLSAQGLCYAIHDVATDRLLGTTALTDVTKPPWRSALFRIVIGEKDRWGEGLGTEAVRLVMDEAFLEHDFDEVRLEVFSHNERAIAVYERIGFRRTGEHLEWVERTRFELNVLEMKLSHEEYVEALDAVAASEPA